MLLFSPVPVTHDTRTDSKWVYIHLNMIHLISMHACMRTSIFNWLNLVVETDANCKLRPLPLLLSESSLVRDGEKCISSTINWHLATIISTLVTTWLPTPSTTTPQKTLPEYLFQNNASLMSTASMEASRLLLVARQLKPSVKGGWPTFREGGAYWWGRNETPAQNLTLKMSAQKQKQRAYIKHCLWFGWLELSSLADAAILTQSNYTTIIRSEENGKSLRKKAHITYWSQEVLDDQYP